MSAEGADSVGHGLPRDPHEDDPGKARFVHSRLHKVGHEQDPENHGGSDCGSKRRVVEVQGIALRGRYPAILVGLYGGCARIGGQIQAQRQFEFSGCRGSRGRGGLRVCRRSGGAGIAREYPGLGYSSLDGGCPGHDG